MSTARSAIRTLLEPRSVAVVGASAHLTRMSGIIVSKFRQFGFTGDVYPVNPKYDEVAGFRCHADLSELAATPPDVAVLYVRATEAVAAARQCADLGVRGLIVLSAGFAEMGAEGSRLQAELADVVRGNDMALCGPNTAGMANFGYGFVAYGTTSVAVIDSFRRGSVAMISASGGLGASVQSYLESRHVGMSHLIGIGNEAATTAADYLDVLVDDDGVRCVLVLLEAVRDPELFFAATRRATAAGKPVVVLKQGRSEVGSRAVQSHTAALSGGIAAFEAACREHGAVVVRDLNAMADAAMLFTRVPPRQDYRIGAVSLPGGGKPLVADTAEDFGFPLPALTPDTVERLTPILPDIAVAENPVDPTAGFGRDPRRLRDGLRTFWTDPGIGVAAFYQSATEPEYSASLAENVVAVARGLDVPLVAMWESGPGLEAGAWSVLHEAGIPLFRAPEDCFRALAAHRDHARRQAGIAAEGEADHGPLAGTDVLAGFDPSSPAAAEELLDRLGVARPKGEVVTSAADAARVAAAAGGPVALKLHEPVLAHKTEAGGVRLDLDGEDAVTAAFDDLVLAVERAGHRVESVLVQPMVGDGVEILVGVHTDPSLGPVLTVGFGGVLTELVGDVAHRVVPVSRAAAEEMVGELRCAPLLRGFRGLPVRDEEALVDVVLRVSWAAHQLRNRAPELEFNPIKVLDRGRGAIAVDWVLSVAPPEEAP